MYLIHVRFDSVGLTLTLAVIGVLSALGLMGKTFNFHIFISNWVVRGLYKDKHQELTLNFT